jgi:hypothetical protein
MDLVILVWGKRTRTLLFVCLEKKNQATKVSSISFPHMKDVEICFVLFVDG